MRELTYHLQKEDYMDWIHWNVRRQNQRKVHIATLIVYIIFLVLYIGGNIISKKPPLVIASSVVMMGFLGVFMFYIVSEKHQSQIVWKRSGLKKLEKTDGFPTVQLTVGEDGLTMVVPDEIHKEYSYADIKEIQEIDRLFLLAAASDGTWQFVAKSAFENEAQISEFKKFMEEKIADAKENPEKYRKAEEEKEEEAEAPVMGYSVSYSSDEGDEEVEIAPVDTSNMGKIGKMAHIMAAMEERSAWEESQEQAEEREVQEAPGDQEEPEAQGAPDETERAESSDWYGMEDKTDDTEV